MNERMTILADRVDLVIGVDTHKHTNTAAVVRATTGGVLEDMTVAADLEGHEALFALAEAHGGSQAWAIEGTGSYGAGLTCFLRERGEWVIELERPGRPARHGGKKSDPIDAARCAREALTRSELGESRSNGERTALSVLLVARRSAVDARTDAQRQIHSLLVAAPEALRAKFRGNTVRQTILLASRLRTTAHQDTETKTTVNVLRSLARRVLELSAETAVHEKAMVEIVRSWHPELLDECGVGPVVAATVLCAWSHAGRFRSESVFASLAGTAPVPASSGMTNRHRVNHGGDRQLNRALQVVVINRLRRDESTRAYVERRRAEGKTDREIKRCLKRYVARQLFRKLEGAPSRLDTL
jgi:transposase